MGLEKAKLQEITSAAAAQPVGTAVDVQFNPTSLKLVLTNTMEGGQAKGRQKRQYIGSSSTKLSMQLIFDTADEGTESKPRSVRELTSGVARFLLPKKEGTKDVPAKVRFQWGTFLFEGIIDSLSEEVDLFAEDGTPLRAKIDVTITEQKASYQFLEAGPGASKGGQAKRPGEPPGAGPGSSGSGGTDRTGEALGGEAAVDFAARFGLDPGAWRSFADQLDDPLSLSAGLSVDFDLSAGLSLGLGATAGFSAGIEFGAGIEIGGGLDISLSAGADFSAGFALSAAGGVGAAVETVKIARATRAAAATRAAFQAPAAPSRPSAPAASRDSASKKPVRPRQERPPLAAAPGRPASAALSATAAPRGEATSAASAPRPPVADPRSTSFGFGVPLRTQVATAAQDYSLSLAGGGPLQSRTGGAAVPTTTDPTIPSWVALPEREAGRSAADRTSRNRTPAPCGCSGGCNHGKKSRGRR
jgi:hypothetical protein